MIELTEEFILSELKNLTSSYFVGIFIITIVLLISSCWLFRCLYFVRKEKVSDKVNIKKRTNLFEIFSIFFLTLFCGAWLYGLVMGGQELFSVQSAITNKSYEIKEFEVLDKYFRTEFDRSSTTTETRYIFCFQLEGYGETTVSEEEYDKIMIGDSVYLVFIKNGKDQFNTGLIYLVGEYFYQE